MSVQASVQYIQHCAWTSMLDIDGMLLVDAILHDKIIHKLACMVPANVPLR